MHSHAQTSNMGKWLAGAKKHHRLGESGFLTVGVSDSSFCSILVPTLDLPDKAMLFRDFIEHSVWIPKSRIWGHQRIERLERRDIVAA